uniref:YkgJ family cysteine cluster protein n=1 Tax=Parendozoicomonas callyspongiae TaxID=2942213 RepID=UPI002FCD3E31
MSCRVGCGACCISPSISTPIPGMPNGKPAGVRCIQLDDKNLCRLFGKPERPAVCGKFAPDSLTCGESSEEAMLRILELEQLTAS